jgi:outer membrane protein assembly factor BamA/autotransporter translocation and assembly factor TamB
VRSSRKRRSLLAAGAVLAFILVVFFFGWFPQAPVRRLVEARLRSALGPRARVGAVHVVPGRLAVDVRDLAFEGPGYSVEVQRAGLVLAPATLLGHSLSVDSLVLESPRVVLRPVAPATTPAPAAAPLAKPIHVRSLLVRGATLVYDDPALGGPVTFENVQARGSLGDGVLEVDAGGGRWQRPRPVALGPTRLRLRASALLDLRIESLDAGTVASRITATGALGRPGALSPDLTFSTHVDLADVATILDTPATSGRLAGKGRVEAQRVEATLEGRGLSFSGWPIAAATLHAVQEKAKTTASARLEMLGGHVDAEALLTGSALDATVHAAGVDLDRLRRRIAPAAAPLQGTLSADVGAKGDIDGPLPTHAHLTANARREGLAVLTLGNAEGVVDARRQTADLIWNVAVNGEGSGGAGRAVLKGTARGPLPPAIDGVLEGTLGFRGQEMTLAGSFAARGSEANARVEARGLGGVLSIAAATSGSTLRRLEARGDSLSLEPLAAGLRGTAQVSLAASGPADRLTGSGALRLEGVGWHETDVGSVTLDVDAHGGEADLELEVPAFHASGRGHATRPGRNGRLTGTLTLAATPLAPLAPLLQPGTPLEGEVTGSVDVTLPFARPSNLELRGRVEQASFASGRLSAQTTRPATIAFAHDRVVLEDVGLAGSGLTLALSGSLGLGPRAVIDLQATLDADLGQVSTPEGWSLGGSGHADVHLTGTKARPEARGSVTARDLTASGPRLPALRASELRLDLEGDAVVVPSLTASLADGTLTLSGRVPIAAVVTQARRSPPRLQTQEEARLDVTWDGVAIEALLERLRPGPSAARGKLSGALQLSGGLAALSEVRSALSLSQTTLDVEEQPITIAPVSMRLDSGRLATEGIAVEAQGGTLRIEGNADLVRRRLDVTGKGSIDLRALSPFLSETAVSGNAEVDLAVGGSLNAPEPRGSVRIRDGSLRVRALPQALTALMADVVFDEKAVRIDGGSARFGGGDVTISGRAALKGGGLADADFRTEGREIALRYPPGLKTRANADVTLAGRTGAFVLGGTVTVLSGLYDLDVALEANLSAPAAAPTESPLLRSIALDLRIDVANPVAVRNNLADLRGTGSLTLRGTMETPAPFGRFDILPGGKVYFQSAQVFLIEPGSSLTYEGSWDPNVSIAARIEKPISDPGENKRYDVRLEAKGTLENLDIKFKSDAGVTDEQAMALVMTGSIQSDALTSAKLVAGQQAAMLVAGRVSRGFGRGLKQLGIDEVALQPELIARETDPGARFTFGKQITPDVKLIYSLPLNSPDPPFLRMEARVLRHVTLSIQRDGDGVVSYGAGQEIRLGGPRASQVPAERKVRLAGVRFEGDQPLAEDLLRKSVRARTDKRVTPFDLQDDADRLRERLIEEGRLEAEVGARLEDGTAVFRIRAGPRYRWRVEGMPNPPNLDDVLRKALFEEEALELGRKRLLDTLRSRGHLKSSVATRTVTEGDERILSFSVTLGPVLTVEDVSFPGAKVLSRSALIEATGGVAPLLLSPQEAIAGIVNAYRERHYLAIDIGLPQVREAGSRVSVVVPISEGEPAKVAAVVFKGATLPESDLQDLAGLKVGEPYSETRARAAADRLTDRYLTLGYPAIRVRPTLEPAGGDLTVAFVVTEGERVVVGSVALTGLGRTRAGVVRRQVDFKPGDPLDPRRLARIEQRLLGLGAFSRVATTVSGDAPATVTFNLREEAPLILRYDVRYSKEDKWSGLVDAESRNLLGTAATLGGRYDRGTDFDEARGSLQIPSYGFGSFTFLLSKRQETFSAVGFSGEPVENRRRTWGIEVQDAIRLPDRWTLLVGYKRKRVVFTSFIGEFTNRVASLSSSLLRDTRDNVLDPRRGRLLAFNIEVSPRFVGSELRYVRGFAQASIARSLNPSLTWAQGYQIGLAQGLSGQDLDCPQLFQLGGPKTLRGFAVKSVGPVDSLCGIGGGAAIVLGEELRYRHVSGIGGALFYEAGNAFSRISDIDLKLRHVLGAGLRYESPVGLLRLDIGLPLGRRPGESSYRVFFGFGQAF